MDIRSLLYLLSDGEIHSGSELGASLGVSRAAIWKQLSHLEDLGLTVESVKGKGYKLASAMDLLDKEKVVAALSSSAKSQVGIEVAFDVLSTNQSMMERISAPDDPDYCFLFAEMQRQGRGRRGRSWLSPFGKNIYLSVGFDLPGGVESLSGLSLVVGLVVVRALKEVGCSAAMLKWPNDVWVDDKKLAGILIELQGEATTGWRVVAGVGLNVYMDESDAEELDQPWISLSSVLPSCSKNILATALVEHFCQVMGVFKVSGFSGFLDEWMAHDVLLGRRISIVGGGESGEAMGVDVSGALLMRSDNEIKAVSAGEVSVRPNDT